MNKITTFTLTTLPLWLGLGAACLCPLADAAAGEAYYTGEQVYRSRPNPDRETPFGHIGVTGVMARIYPGVTVKVEQTMPGSPAAGKFSKGEIITGINGVALKGRNPFVTLGNALTKAEATDGRMVFDVTSADGKAERKETVSIPVLGAYSKTWPLDCGKSKKIIEQAAEFYADKKKFNQGGIPGALACLFLLSTGDDQYLPRVKAYFDAFPKDVREDRRPHLEQRLQRHRLRRVLPAHRRRVGAADPAVLLRRREETPEVRLRLDALGHGRQSRLRRRRPDEPGRRAGADDAAAGQGVRRERR